MISVNQADSLKVMIRPMRSDDLQVIVRLEREIFPDPWPKSAFEDHLEHPDWGGYVAVNGDEIIGYGCWMVIAEEAHLTNIAVAPDHRRKSVAQSLLQHILEVTKRRSCEFILLEVRPSNENAITFYRKHGFDVLYRRPSYYHKPVEDALVMVRYFDE